MAADPEGLSRDSMDLVEREVSMIESTRLNWYDGAGRIGTSDSTKGDTMVSVPSPK